MKSLSEKIRNQDIKQLRLLSLEKGGFKTNSLRREAWSLLLKSHAVSKQAKSTRKAILSADIKRQIEMDVHRSFLNFGLSTQDVQRYRTMLSKTIQYVLSKLSWLHYYQGFHDICSVFVFVCGEHRAKQLLLTVSTMYLRDFMQEDMIGTMKQVEVIMKLLQKIDPHLYSFLLKIPDFHPYFGIPWILTWLSHNISPEKVVRLFDVLISSHPIFISTISCAILVQARDQLLTCDQDMSDILFVLCNLKFESMDLDDLIQTSHAYYQSTTIFNMIQDPYSVYNTFNRFEELDVNEMISFEKVQYWFEEYGKAKDIKRSKINTQTMLA
jgi:hypothetical protein